MKVREVMTVAVVAIAPESGIREIAQLFLQHRIGGAPVVDAGGAMLGMVCASDLLRSGRREEPPPRTAGEVMSTDVLALHEDMEVSEAARALERHGFKRAPVVREGRLVGMVTRSDLLRPYLRTDSEIRAEVEMDVLVGTLGLSTRDVQVGVRDGVVRLTGSIAQPGLARILRRMVGSIDGVVGVDDGLTGSEMNGNGDGR